MKVYTPPKENETIWEKVKRKASDFGQNVGTFLDENKERIILATPFVIGGFGALKSVAKHLSKRNLLRKEESLKTLYIYDRSLGFYWPLKRKLSVSEYQYIARCHRMGEGYHDILQRMNVLK